MQIKIFTNLTRFCNRPYQRLEQSIGNQLSYTAIIVPIETTSEYLIK
jgi:hypothetical protein